jgi:hypothetical protein
VYLAVGERLAEVRSLRANHHPPPDRRRHPRAPSRRTPTARRDGLDKRPRRVPPTRNLREDLA